MFGESGLDQAPADREIGIVGRQSPDAVKMIRHHDDGVDFKRTRLANGSKSIASEIDSLIRSQNETAAKCRRERWRVDIAWAVSGYAALTRSTKTVCHCFPAAAT